MKCWIGLWVLFLATTLPASPPGQSVATTRPADVPPWPAAVGHLAQALLKSNLQAAQILTADADIRRMDDGKHSIERLVAVTADARLLGAHAYLYPPLAMGADIAADFKTAESVPQEIRKRMIPSDDDGMKRANATAAQWMGQILDAKQDDPVGVLIFWRPAQEKKDLLGAAAGPKILFVLVKGKPINSTRFGIVELVYGNPLGNTN